MDFFFLLPDEGLDWSGFTGEDIEFVPQQGMILVSPTANTRYFPIPSKLYQSEKTFLTF